LSTPRTCATSARRCPAARGRREHLEGKSIADLQQIWFTLLRERNMLYSMKDHYTAHMDELGALPAPSRIKMGEVVATAEGGEATTVFAELELGKVKGVRARLPITAGLRGDIYNLQWRGQ
jgi:hypothetical protein